MLIGVSWMLLASRPDAGMGQTHYPDGQPGCRAVNLRDACGLSRIEVSLPCENCFAHEVFM